MALNSSRANAPSFTTTTKTRFCLISDTHARQPFPAKEIKHAFRKPLPPADVLLHAGDLTEVGRIDEHERTFAMIEEADAELKLVIAGNHDLTLDRQTFPSTCKHIRRESTQAIAPELCSVEELWKGEKARTAGIVYLEEGTRTFQLNNGAQFTVYSSPYSPEFCGWAFPYSREEDRYNPPDPECQNPSFIPPHHIPSWPAVDIMLTHGPPQGIRDTTAYGSQVGCNNLRAAVARCRPRLHVFGHIHEGWGALRHDWQRNSAEPLMVDEEKLLKDRGVFVNVARGSGQPLKFGVETLFVNAAIMDVDYQPVNAPWIVDLDLPVAATG